MPQIVSHPEFVVEVTHSEMVKHLAERAAHHKDRERYYKEESAKLRETAEKFASAENTDGIKLPDEILAAVSVDGNPFNDYVGGMGAVQSMGGMIGAAVRNKGRMLEHAQSALKAQVGQQLDRLIKGHEASAMIHASQVQEFEFVGAHLPAGKTRYELCLADLQRFEFIRVLPAGMSRLAQYGMAPMFGNDYVQMG